MRETAAAFILASPELEAFLSASIAGASPADVAVSDEVVEPFYSSFFVHLAYERAGGTPPPDVLRTVADSLVRIDHELASSPAITRRGLVVPEQDGPVTIYFTVSHGRTVAALVAAPAEYTGSDGVVVVDPEPPAAEYLLFFNEAGEVERMITTSAPL